MRKYLFKCTISMFFIICISFVLKPCKSEEANNISFIVGGGPMYYMGELQTFSFPDPQLVHPSIGVGINIRPIHAINLRIEYIKGSISGVDSISIKSFSQERNLNFYSTIDAVNLSAAINLFNFKGRFALSPYVIGGVGIFHFNPKTKLENRWVELQPLGTEGQFISSGNYPKPYNLWQINIPLGLGISYRITKSIEVKLDATYHKTFTDYLDDVSGYYPNMDDLANSPNGDIAVLLSNKGSLSVNETTPRGNSIAMDGFVHFGLSITFNPWEYKKRSTKQKYQNIINQGNCKKLNKNLKISTKSGTKKIFG